MIDGFDRLRHDIVVGRNDDNGDICYFGASCTHGGKRFVTGSIEECDTAAVFENDIICPDVLRDTSGFTGDDIGITYVVEQRCFTMIDVSHDGYDGWTLGEIFFPVFFVVHRFGNLCTYIFGFIAKFFGDDIDGFCIEALIYRYHDAEAHAGGDDIVYRHIHEAGQVIGRYKFGKFQYTAFFHLAFGSFLCLVRECLPFFFTPFCAFFLAF